MRRISAHNLRVKPKEIILGIDPGLSVTGWGVVLHEGGNFEYLAHGSISTSSSEPLHKRLGHIHSGIDKVVSDHSPDAVAIENFFVGINCHTTIQTVHARGVLLLAFSSFSALSVGEYAPNSVKKCLVGEGHATKDQVQFMVRHFLKLGKGDDPKFNNHESDALALSICHAQNRFSRLVKEFNR